MERWSVSVLSSATCVRTRSATACTCFGSVQITVCVCVCVLLAVLSSTAGLAMSNQCICVCTQACLYVLPTIIKTERNQCMCVYACSCRLGRTVRVHNMSIHCATHRRNWYMHVRVRISGEAVCTHTYIQCTFHCPCSLSTLIVHTSLPP